MKRWLRPLSAVGTPGSAAGGTGTDYLRNVEEIQFNDTHEQLVVDKWSWAYTSNVQVTDRSWLPMDDAVALATDIDQIVH